VDPDALVLANLDFNTGAKVDITGALDISTLFNLPPYCQVAYSYTLNGADSVDTTISDGLPTIDTTSSTFEETLYTFYLTATPFTGSVDSGSKTIELVVGCFAECRTA